MKHDRDRVDHAGGLLPPLDAEPGPMPPLSAAEADAIAWGAVSRWAARVPGVEPADGELGPARPLPAEHAERLAQQVMRRQRAGGARVARQLGPGALRAAAALLVVSLAGASFAAYRYWPALRGSEATLPAKPAIKAARAAPPERASESRQPEAATTPAQPSPQKPKPEAPNEGESPAELLARANALRAQHRWAAAEHLYRKALGGGATDQQRYVALVAAASLALQHLDKPARALALYRSALALMPEGDLSEEVSFGIAECQRALADTNAERAALRQFSAEHPDSWLMKLVKRRLEELGP